MAKIEIRKNVKGNGDIYFAAYKDGESTFITSTCTFVTSSRNEEEALDLCEKTARQELTPPTIEVVKTFEI